MCCPLVEFLEDRGLSKKIKKVKEEAYKEYFENIKGVKLKKNISVKILESKDKGGDEYAVKYDGKQVYVEVKERVLHYKKNTQPFKVQGGTKQHDNIVNDLSIDDLLFFIKIGGKKQIIEIREL